MSMMKYPLYKYIALEISGFKFSKEKEIPEWMEKHLENLQKWKEKLPHGAGLDEAVKVNLEKSKTDKIVIDAEYHYMNESGYYAGWYIYSVVVTPSLVNGINIEVKGKNTPNDAKEYIWEVFYEALTGEY